VRRFQLEAGEFEHPDGGHGRKSPAVLAAISASSADGEMLPHATPARRPHSGRAGQRRRRRLAVAAGDGDHLRRGVSWRTPQANSSTSETTGTPRASAA
jgi:hypothetical protein